MRFRFGRFVSNATLMRIINDRILANLARDSRDDKESRMLLGCYLAIKQYEEENNK